MKSFFTALLLLVLPVSAFAHLSADNKDLLNRASRVNAITALGTEVANRTTVVKVTYDFSVSGGAIGTINLSALNAKIPSGAILRQCGVNVLTTVTSGGSATLAFGMNSSTDILAASAYTSFTSTAMIATNPTGATASWIKASADRRLTLTIGTAALTAGKLDVYCDYVSIP